MFVVEGVFGIKWYVGVEEEEDVGWCVACVLAR
jgi:hypothetical protein